MALRILTEASGSLTAGYLINSIKESGYLAVASDIEETSVGKYLADDFILMPPADDGDLWEKTIELIKEKKIDVVIPSLDETLLGWAERKDELAKQNIAIILSNPETIRICQDKWLTYEFFLRNNIPTPETDINQKYPLIKPRFGRGGEGILITSQPVCMNGMISQERLIGQEYTVDVLCNKRGQPIYIIPRQRIGVKEGKSTGGVTVNNSEIIFWVKRICERLAFKGPINIQCFDCKEEGIKFTEINPRIAGGMVLGFAATENWIPLLLEHFIYGKEITDLKPIQYGMMMRRYYAEVFVSPGNMGSN